jgi:hypothetical protein
MADSAHGEACAMSMIPERHHRVSTCQQKDGISETTRCWDAIRATRERIRGVGTHSPLRGAARPTVRFHARQTHTARQVDPSASRCWR